MRDHEWKLCRCKEGTYDWIYWECQRCFRKTEMCFDTPDMALEDEAPYWAIKAKKIGLDCDEELLSAVMLS